MCLRHFWLGNKSSCKHFNIFRINPILLYYARQKRQSANSLLAKLNYSLLRLAAASPSIAFTLPLKFRRESWSCGERPSSQTLPFRFLVVKSSTFPDWVPISAQHSHLNCHSVSPCPFYFNPCRKINKIKYIGVHKVVYNMDLMYR